MNSNAPKTDGRMRTRGKMRKTPRTIATTEPKVPDPERVLSHTRQRHGTISLRNLMFHVAPEEAETLRNTHPLTLGWLLASTPVPDTLPSAGELVRIHSLPVPAEAAAELASAWPEDRVARIRATLIDLAEAHAQGRWVLSKSLHPRTPLERERIGVGDGRYVARAVWRRQDGSPRAGRRGPSTCIYVTGKQLGLGDVLHDGYELVDGDWNTLELFGAQSLHDAAGRVILRREREQRDVTVLSGDRPERHS